MSFNYSVTISQPSSPKKEKGTKKPSYAQMLSPKTSRQGERTLGRTDEIQNHDGAYVYKISPWDRLDRWLILGSDKPTFYAEAQRLSKENANSLLECLALDGPRTVDQIVDCSLKGKAPKVDATLFALSLALKLGDEKTRQKAAASLVDVARIGTHLFASAETVEALGGWGRVTKRAFASWYQRDPALVFYQMMKYRNRHGFTHRDLLRLCHPKPLTPDHKALYLWATKGISLAQKMDAPPYENYDSLPWNHWQKQMQAFEDIQDISDASLSSQKKAASLISEYHLPHETVPDQLKQSKLVWSALLEHMPPTALLRSLGKLTEVGVISPLSEGSKLARKKIEDHAHLVNARVHPLAILTAQRQYAAGHGSKGHLVWTPDNALLESLHGAFYGTFASVEPTGLNWLLCLDISGSMDRGTVGSIDGFTPRMATASMTLVTANVESNWAALGFSHSLTHLNITPSMKLDDVQRYMASLPFGNTDCALPMVDALKRRIPVDVFVIITDNETNSYGSLKPSVALNEYREKMGRDTKMIVVALTATDLSIADPLDKNSLDIAGFSQDIPAVMSQFVLPTSSHKSKDIIDEDNN